MPATNVAWGGATLTVMVAGTDVSCDVLRLTVDRSKNRLWDPPDAGTCQIALDITRDGVTTGLGAVGSVVTVRIAYGSASRFLFSGQVQRRRPQVEPEGDVLTLDCVDGFETLARLNLRANTGDTPVGGGEAVQQRIARWLNAAGWASGARTLDSSTFTCPATLMDGNVLLQIQAAAVADGGDFFIDGAGVATFKSWAWHTSGQTAQAIFSDRRQADWVPYSSASVTTDLDEVQNRVYGTRRAITGETTPPVTQLAENTSSVTTYGARGDALDDLELATDTQVGTRVTNLVGVAGGPNARFDSIVVQPAFEPGRCWPAVIPCTFSSLIAANRLWEDGTTTNLYGHVIGEQWTFTPDDATVEFRVSGTGTWDGTRPPRPPEGVVINQNGCLQIPDGYPCDHTSTVVVRDAGHNVLQTYPPGSLCFPNEICSYPPNTVEVCYRDASGNTACFPLDDPRLTAILWADVLNPPGLALIERVEAIPIDFHPSLDSTIANVAPGIDAMDAGTTGGAVCGGHSGRLEAASFNGGWTVDFWYALGTLPAIPGNSGFKYLVALHTVNIRITTLTGILWNLEVEVLDATSTVWLSGTLHTLTDGGWHHYVFIWDQVAGTLRLLVDGTEV